MGEIGYAEAKGLPVFLWSEEPKLLEDRTAGTGGRDPDGWLIERFGLAETLMVAVNQYRGSAFEDALARALGLKTAVADSPLLTAITRVQIAYLSGPAKTRLIGSSNRPPRIRAEGYV